MRRFLLCIFLFLTATWQNVTRKKDHVACPFSEWHLFSLKACKADTIQTTAISFQLDEVPKPATVNRGVHVLALLTVIDELAFFVSVTLSTRTVVKWFFVPEDGRRTEFPRIGFWTDTLLEENTKVTVPCWSLCWPYHLLKGGTFSATALIFRDLIMGMQVCTDDLHA
jgi:hypothetical protein